MPPQSDEIQKADPNARRRALRSLVPIAAIGLLLATVLTAWGDRAATHPTLVVGGVVLLGLAGLVMTRPLFRFWRIGQAVRRHGRFPPDGIAVIRDTRLLHGTSARRHGEALQVLAALMMFFVLSVPVIVAWLVWRLNVTT